MLDLKLVTHHTAQVSRALATRGVASEAVNAVANLARERNQLLTQVQSLEAQRNQFSKLIGTHKAQGLATADLLAQVGGIKRKIDDLQTALRTLDERVTTKLALLPNIPAKGTPVGRDDTANVVLATHDHLGRGLVANVQPHFEIGAALGLVDFERSVRMAGTRFWAYRGLGARLARALENFMLDLHTKHGYEEWRPPVLVNQQALFGTGQLPKFADDLFKIEGRDSYLIPTAEVPLTNLVQDEILDLTHPRAFTAFTPCFRAEAGSGGRDVRGLIRGHQFNKVELVKIVTHDQLIREFTRTLRDAKRVLVQLGLPFREVQLCTGDLGFAASATVDLEVWMPSERRFREISSVSQFSDFQGRRAGIRYRTAAGTVQPACTINASGLAIDRTIAALLENYQEADGSISLPRVLHKYMKQKTLPGKG